MSINSKIVPYFRLEAWRASLGANQRPLVATNGCFDILHPGHLFLFEQARMHGNCLVVGVNSDAQVRKLKGEARPAISENDRVMLLAALEAVSVVCVFPEEDARQFIMKCQPDTYVKGGDYTIDTINQDERHLLDRMKIRVEILPRFENHSTSTLLKQIVTSQQVKTGLRPFV